MEREAEDGGVGVTVDRFVSLMTRKIRQQDPSDYLQQLFSAFDVGGQCRIDGLSRGALC